MLSIIIPTYNNSHKLLHAISSILNHNNHEIEIIIIDDLSIDDTEKKIQSLNNTYIRYFKNSQKLGTTKSRINGIKKSKGDYIGFLDDDDIFLPHKLNKQIQKIGNKICYSKK